MIAFGITGRRLSANGNTLPHLSIRLSGDAIHHRGHFIFIGRDQIHPNPSKSAADRCSSANRGEPLRYLGLGLCYLTLPRLDEVAPPDGMVSRI